MSAKIEDYALIGDMHTAALVSRAGSIDWLCFPRFDSGACFAKLLGDDENGRWLLAPVQPDPVVSRQYRPGTLVLETTFETGQGVVRTSDCMPLRNGYPCVVRVVEALRGAVDMQTELVIRFDYGSVVPWVRQSGGVLRAIGGPDGLSLHSNVETHGVDLRTRGEFTLAQGERAWFVLSWFPSHEQPPEPPDAAASLERTANWWREWSGRCAYDGPYREMVVRALISLKALTYEPTGGIVAAATASLPERFGGVRNWDYRYCWLRDATFALLGLAHAGYEDEAAAWHDWLLRAAAGEPSKLQILYGLAGERRIEEYELSWLSGYEDSRPVRVGNAASSQYQLDVYGEVLDAAHQGVKEGLHADLDEQHLLAGLADFVAEHWREPDRGMWEVRGDPQPFTHSRVMAWVALDRIARHPDAFPPADIARWARVRDEIHADVCRHGFDPKRNTFTQYFGSTALDASALLMPIVGFLPADDPRVVGTIAAIERALMHDGFVLRYATEPGRGADDGLPPGEGVFLACSFWLADAYVLSGRNAEAKALFERIVAVSNDVGLLSEEYDVEARRLAGNFPQAFSHVGLLNTALNIWHAESPARERSGTGGERA